MDQLISSNITEIQALCNAHHVKSLFAFGSVCTDTFSEQSDVDLLVSFYPMDYGDYADNYFNFVEELEQLLSRPVDLITDKSLSNPYFIDSINKTKVYLYGQRDQKVLLFPASDKLLACATG